MNEKTFLGRTPRVAAVLSLVAMVLGGISWFLVSLGATVMLLFVAVPLVLLALVFSLGGMVLGRVNPKSGLVAAGISLVSLFVVLASAAPILLFLPSSGTGPRVASGGCAVTLPSPDWRVRGDGDAAGLPVYENRVLAAEIVFTPARPQDLPAGGAVTPNSRTWERAGPAGTVRVTDYGETALTGDRAEETARILTAVLRGEETTPTPAGSAPVVVLRAYPLGRGALMRVFHDRRLRQEMDAIAETFEREPR